MQILQEATPLLTNHSTGPAQKAAQAGGLNIQGSKVKRNIVREIQERKARSADSARITMFADRHASIAAAYKRLLRAADSSSTTADPELSRYFPVALVAAVEGYFRQCVADLVNSGSPYPERAATVKELRPNAETRAALNSGRITPGDHIAHFISIGSLEDINRVLSALVDFDFLERLLTSDFHLFDDEEPLAFREYRATVIDAARDLFHTRHMLCHEFAPSVQPDTGEVLRMLTIADALVALAEVILIGEEQDPGD